MKSKWLLLILFSIGTIALQPALAKKHRNQNKVRGVQITEVNAADSKITITIAHNNQVITYMVPLGTELTIDGAAAKLTDLKPGMYVASYTEGDAGTLSQLDASNNVIK
jgi:hypothetical protein